MILTEGWTKYDGGERKDKILPKLDKGDKVNVDFHPEEKQTQPPKHYTIETLNNYLKNPFRDEKSSDESDDEDYKAIFKGLELGTEATRTGIIDNAKKSGYISLKKDVYNIEKGGRFLIEQLVDMNISMDKYKTSQLGQALKKVYHGEMTVEESVKIAENEIKEVFDNDRNAGSGFFGDEIGVCPKCGKKVTRGRFAYVCEGADNFGNIKHNGDDTSRKSPDDKSAPGKCDFKINLHILGCAITKEQAAKILSDGRTDKLDFISKSGKNFSARLKLDNDKKIIFDFT